MSTKTAIIEKMKEALASVLPILLIVLAFLLFQLIAKRLTKTHVLRILVGILFTYVGLVLFLTGVNVGFSGLGYVLGNKIASTPYEWVLIPLAMVMGWFIIRAEPAIHILNKQVEELSAGAISARSMGIALSVAIALANGFALTRVLTGLSIFLFLIPGYAIAIVLSFFVPPTFTSIAFDSGGVASGPLTATFMLPFALGACSALGGNSMTDVFGLVALVAMMPLITVQVMGAVTVLKSKRLPKAEPLPSLADERVIELWERN